MHLEGRRCDLPPNPPPAFFLFSCLLSQPNTFQEQHSKQKRKNKTTSAMDSFCFKVASVHSQIPSKTNTKTKKTRTNKKKKKQHMQRILNASGGEALRPPPNTPPALCFKLPPLTAKHLQRTTFQTKTQDAKDTQSRLPPLTAKHLPRATLQTKTQEQNYQCKGFFCFKVASSHSQIPSKHNIPNKNTRRRSIESTGTEKCGQDLAKGARNWKRERGNRKKDGK